ncbi:MAG TPA: hypothetical protein VNC22_01735, partial [Sporichthya sp.]|nr:hypothetical protein [Sporichthya sp.]
AARLPAGAALVGPAPPAEDDEVRAVLRAPRARGGELAAALRAAAGVRSARKAVGAVRIQVDPTSLG